MGVLAALAGCPESSKLPPPPSHGNRGPPRPSCVPNLRLSPSRTPLGHAVTTTQEAPWQHTGKLPTGSAGKSHHSGREESSRGRAAGRARAARGHGVPPPSPAPEQRAPRRRRPPAQPGASRRPRLPPARRAAGACSSSWLCPDVIQTWQQFDFKGEAPDLPDAGSRPRVTGREVGATRSRPLGRRRRTGRRDPEMPPPSPARPPASPRTRMAPHPSSAAKVSPRGAGTQKPLPRGARTSGGPGPGGPPPAAPRGPRGPHGHMRLFVFRPARRCLRAAAGCRMVSLGRDPWRSPRGGWGRRAAPGPEPRPPPPSRPPTAGPFHPSFALSWRRTARVTRPAPARELATFTLLFKLARRHHQQITLSCRAAGRDSARSSLLTWSRTRRREPGRSSKHVACHVGHKKQWPAESAGPAGADCAAASMGSDRPSEATRAGPSKPRPRRPARRYR